MKKFMILVLAIMLAGTVFSTIAMAAPETEEPIIEVTTVEEAEVQETVYDAGILPDSPFYYFKLFLEKLQLTFTFDQEAKAQRLMEMAERRLTELAALPEEKQAKYIERLTEAFVEALEEADELKREEEDEVSEAVYEEVYEPTMKSLEVLQRVYLEAPEQAKQGLQRAIDVKLAKLNGIKPGPNTKAPGRNKVKDQVKEPEDDDDLLEAEELEDELEELEDELEEIEEELEEELEELEDDDDEYEEEELEEEDDDDDDKKPAGTMGRPTAPGRRNR